MNKEIYDVIIIGAGPAGLSAGIYAGRSCLKTLIIEKAVEGGRVVDTREVVNYPGVRKTTGKELTDVMVQQCHDFGVEFITQTIKNYDLSGEIKTISSRHGEFKAKTVILANGTSEIVLGIDGETRLRGNGVSYCATCDAEFYKGKNVVVVGSGDQGIEEGCYITKFANSVTTIVIHPEGVLDCNKFSAQKAFKNPKMHFVWNSTLSKIEGENEVTGVQIMNLITKEKTEFPCDGVFMFVGMTPNTKGLEDKVELDRKKWIVTDDLMHTNVPGVFAAGDVRQKVLRQISTAISDGAIAATQAEKYITSLEDKKKGE